MAQETGKDRLLRAIRTHTVKQIESRPLAVQMAVVTSAPTDAGGFAVELPEHGFQIDNDNIYLGHCVKQFDADYGLSAGDTLAVHCTSAGDWVAVDVLSGTQASYRGTTLAGGHGAPSGGTGRDGDFYLDEDSNTLYGPKASGSWAAGTSLIGPTGPTGPIGPTGPSGAAGNTVLNGSGAPSSGTGNDGDFYLDVTSMRFYGPKAAGAWPTTYSPLQTPHPFLLMGA